MKVHQNQEDLCELPLRDCGLPVQLKLLGSCTARGPGRELVPGLVVSRSLAGYLVHLQNEGESEAYNLYTKERSKVSLHTSWRDGSAGRMLTVFNHM